MDPNNNQPQVDNEALKKIEEDLKKMSQESTTVENPMTNTVGPVAAAAATPVVQQTPAVQPIEPAPTSPEIDTTTSKSQPIETNAAGDITNNPHNKNNSPLLLVSIILVVVALLSAVAYVLGAKYISSKNTQKACTLEAKMCPDGTSVGRSGPNCDFDACPQVVPTPQQESSDSGVVVSTPAATASASPTINPTSSPAASPKASPIAN